MKHGARYPGDLEKYVLERVENSPLEFVLQGNGEL